MIKNNLLILFILSTPLVSAANSLADANEDYYKQIRSLKKLNPVDAKKIREKTIDAELIRKANETSRANTEANKEATERIKKLGKSTPTTSSTELKEVKKRPQKTQAPADSPSDPVKVSHETPDELSFPGDEEKETSKKK